MVPLVKTNLIDYVGVSSKIISFLVELVPQLVLGNNFGRDIQKKGLSLLPRFSSGPGGTRHSTIQVQSLHLRPQSLPQLQP